MVRRIHVVSDGGTNTFFAPAPRASQAELEAQIAAACGHPVSNAVLEAFRGVVLVLNQQRQIIAVNEAVLEAMGIEDPGGMLGLRPGEALGCKHAGDGPNGCGTGKYCRTCGAVISIMACQTTGQSAEAECVLTTADGGTEQTMDFLARAIPVQCGEHKLTVIALQDIAARKNLDALDRVFLHDLGPLMTALHDVSERLAAAEPGEHEKLDGMLQRLIARLAETAAQHADLSATGMDKYRPRLTEVTVDTIFADVAVTMANTELAGKRTLILPTTPEHATVRVDQPLVVRVLVSMVRNALEATEPGGKVRGWCEREPGAVTFKVHNTSLIPAAQAMRVFQRYFTTREGPGRGMGTYGMKFIGERLLGGHVSFTSEPNEGTIFSFRLPQEPVN